MKEQIENKYFIYDNAINKNLKYFIKILLYPIKSCFYRLIISLRKKQNIQKEYSVSICAIFKNEAPYLKEWIEYHKIVGIQHFYMYNNLSVDNYLEILRPYILEGIVTLVDWPYPQTQLKAYNDCITKFKKETKWIGFIDIDEFVVPNNTDTVYDFLKNYENSYGSVMIYWKMFGTSGLMKRDLKSLVIESFFVSWNKYVNIGKCFYNTKFDFDFKSKENSAFHHCLWTLINNKKIPPVNEFGKFCFYGFNFVKSNDAQDFPIQINHYFTKSFKEYEQKASKGDVYFAKNPHNLDYFYYHEMKNQSTDYKIFKYLVKLKLSLKIEK